MDTDDEDKIKEQIAAVEAIYKKAMDQLNQSRLEQYRIIEEYVDRLKEQRLQELKDSISKSG